MLTPVLITVWTLPAILAFLDGRRRGVAAFAAAGLALLGVLLALLLWQVIDAGAEEIVSGGWPAGIGIRLRADALGTTFALLTTLVITAATLQQAARGITSRAFPALAAFLALGLVGLFFTADAFNFYVFFEVAMTASFALAAYGDEPRQYRAAYTFAVVNLLGSVIFLTSVAGLYHVTGTLDMSLAAERTASAPSTALFAIAATMFVAFGLKLGLFPFHFWLPPVYRDTVPAVAAMLSGALANIGTYGLIRFGSSVLQPALADGSWVLLALGGASVLYGGLLALSRTIYAEVLAYSSISQAGYILLAIGLGGPVGYAAAVVYGIANSLNKTLLFLTGDLRVPLLAHTAALGAWSVAGLPPSSGFFAKAALFRAGVLHEHHGVMAVIGVGSVLSIAYMGQAHVRRFWTVSPRSTAGASPVVWLVLAVLALLTVALGVWPEPLFRIGEYAGSPAR
jgi:multicomponent Na+:H+ antiporter subunit D